MRFGVRDTVDATCRCGGKVTAGWVDAPGDPDHDAPVVMHSVPACEDFNRRDTVDFLAWINLGPCE